MRMDLMTWPELEQRLEHDRSIVLPMGSTEQHGPTGLIGTDALVAEAVVRRAETLADILSGPTFNVGYAPHHMGFPGTITLRAETFAAVLTDWITSLVQHGFSHIYVLNGHGGNITPVMRVFEALSREETIRPKPKLCLRNWWMYDPVAAKREALYGKAEGKHATASEVAVTQYLFEQARVVARVLEPRIAPDGPIRSAQDYRARFPDGRIASDPSLANPADGNDLLDLAARALVEDFKVFSHAA